MDPLRVIAVVVIAVLVSAALTPVVIRFARRIGAVDRPNERKVSRRSQMPLLGGLAVAIGCASGLVVAWASGSVGDGLPRIAAFGLGGAMLVAAGAMTNTEFA